MGQRRLLRCLGDPPAVKRASGHFGPARGCLRTALPTQHVHVGIANQFGWFVLVIIVSSQRGGQRERSVVVGGLAALARMTAVAMTIVAAKTIEETVEAEPGPTLRGQLAMVSPVVLPNSAARCSPRRTWDGCDRRHQPTPSRSPAASTATCSLLHLQAVTPLQRSASRAETRRRDQRELTPRRCSRWRDCKFSARSSTWEESKLRQHAELVPTTSAQMPRLNRRPRRSSVAVDRQKPEVLIAQTADRRPCQVEKIARPKVGRFRGPLTARSLHQRSCYAARRLSPAAHSQASLGLQPKPRGPGGVPRP
jgi:hypothetical protein